MGEEEGLSDVIMVGDVHVLWQLLQEHVDQSLRFVQTWPIYHPPLLIVDAECDVLMMRMGVGCCHTCAAS